MPNKYYRLFDHTADLGIEISGADPEALFTNAGHALFEVIAPSVRLPVEGLRRHTISVQGEDWADLMVNWLRELLYLWNGRQQLLGQLRIESLDQNRLQAAVTTGDYIVGQYRIDKEVKAVTYHQVQVGPTNDGWRARVIFDV
ncbi:MAG: archease [Desulfatitalea sp.]